MSFANGIRTADGGTPKQKLLLDECTVVRRAEIKPNFEIL